MYLYQGTSVDTGRAKLVNTFIVNSYCSVFYITTVNMIWYTIHFIKLSSWKPENEVINYFISEYG